MSIQTKNLVIKRFGWKRVCKNTQRFGWILNDAIQHEETSVTTTYEGRISGDKIYFDEHKSSSTRITIHLSFYRSKDYFTNLPVIFPLELIYNIVFFIRRFIGFFLPLLTIGAVIVALMTESNAVNEINFITIWMAVIFIWLGLVMLESILAIIASKILKFKS